MRRLRRSRIETALSAISASQDPRPAHIALHERVFPARELPFYLPNGFGCSCRTVSLSERDVQRLGLEMSRIHRGDLVPYELPNGQKGEALVQPDRGFYVPGQTRAEKRQRMIEAVIARLEPEQARWVRQEVAPVSSVFCSDSQFIQTIISTAPSR